MCEGRCSFGKALDEVIERQVVRGAARGGDELVERQRGGQSPTPTPESGIGDLNLEHIGTEAPTDTDIVERIDEDIRVRAGRYRYWPLFLDYVTEGPSRIELTYTVVVRSGDAIDAVPLELEEFGYNEDGKAVEHLETASRLDTDYATIRSTLSTGSYVPVIDNTTRGSATPFRESSTSTEVSVELEARLVE